MFKEEWTSPVAELFFGRLNLSLANDTWHPEGIEILLPTSKTDQTHEGQYCSIPYGNDELCPIKALENWLAKSNIQEGVIFRRIIHNKITDSALTSLSVNHIIRRAAHKYFKCR